VKGKFKSIFKPNFKFPLNNNETKLNIQKKNEVEEESGELGSQEKILEAMAGLE
jgi:hypothetical protein